MNRRDAGYTVMGMLGAIAGSGCAWPQASKALPSAPTQSQLAHPSETCTKEPIFYAEDIFPKRASRFRVTSGPFTVSASNASIMILSSTDAFEVQVRQAIRGKVTVTDSASGLSRAFDVARMPGHVSKNESVEIRRRDAGEIKSSEMCTNEPIFYPEDIASLFARFRVTSGPYAVASDNNTIAVQTGILGDPELFQITANGRPSDARVTVTDSASGLSRAFSVHFV